MTPKQPAKKLPRARVMWATDNTITDLSVTSEFSAKRTAIDRNPATVIPCFNKDGKPDRKKAEALARFMNLTEEERVDRVAKAAYESDCVCEWKFANSDARENYLTDARAVLRTIFEG